MKVLRPIIALMLLCCTLVTPVAAMDIVVCFGADGHITLEPTRNGRCSTSTWASSHEFVQAEGLSLNAEHCGPCMDIPVLTDDARAHLLSLLPGATQSHLPALTFATRGVPLPLAILPTFLRSVATLALSPTLTALRTIVLLI